MKLAAYLIVLTALLLVVVTFTLQNTNIVAVEFMKWNFESSIAMILFLSFALGIIFTIMLIIPIVISRERTISSLKKELNSIEKQPQEPISNL